MANDGPSEKAKAQIDQNLRQAFHQIAEEPLPQKLTDLLQKLRAGGTAAASRDSRS